MAPQAPQRCGLSEMPRCKCGIPCVRRVVSAQTARSGNKGRTFVCCAKPRAQQCGFFRFMDRCRRPVTRRVAKTIAQKAELLLSGKKVITLNRRAGGDVDAQVLGTAPGVVYTVKVPAPITLMEPTETRCTCPYYKHRGGLCKHGSAVLLALKPESGCEPRRHQPSPVEPVRPEAVSNLASALEARAWPRKLFKSDVLHHVWGPSMLKPIVDGAVIILD